MHYNRLKNLYVFYSQVLHLFQIYFYIIAKYLILSGVHLAIYIEGMLCSQSKLYYNFHFSPINFKTWDSSKFINHHVEIIIFFSALHSHIRISLWRLESFPFSKKKKLMQIIGLPYLRQISTRTKSIKRQKCFFFLLYALKILISYYIAVLVKILIWINNYVINIPVIKSGNECSLYQP